MMILLLARSAFVVRFLPLKQCTSASTLHRVAQDPQLHSRLAHRCQNHLAESYSSSDTCLGNTNAVVPTVLKG